MKNHTTRKSWASILLMSLFVIGSLASSAQAAEATEQDQTANKSKASVATLQKKEEKLKSNDDEITNARLRAQLGSKSRWSFKSDLGFNGGSIEKPFDSVRPNYRAGAQAESLSVLSGNVGINYRLTEKDSINFGTGITVMDPLHGDITQSVVDPRQKTAGNVISRYQVSTPFVSWSRGYKSMGMQQVSSVSYSQYTDSDSANMSAFGNIALSQTILANLGNSNLSGGLSFSFDYTYYNGNAISEYIPYMQAGKIMRDDFGLGIYPFAEYSFNDKYSFRTVFGYFAFSHYKNEYNNPSELKQLQPYQSMGIGVSVTRDIYLYPNIQFIPNDVRAERTNVALSANINVF